MFILSKAVGILSDPFTLFYLVVVSGCLLLRFRRTRGAGRTVLGFALTVVALLALVPFEKPLVTWLEDRFPPPGEMPAHVDGIIILGGGLNPILSAARAMPSLNSAAARMTAAIPLAQRYPDARIIFTGGSGAALEQRFKEARYVADFYREIGFDPGRIVFEDQSRNTRENALLSKQIMAPRPGETWLLITSAFHMPRSVACFRAVGWPVTAYPVDYHTTGESGLDWSDLRFSVAAGLGGLSLILHEAMGLIGYWLAGWTGSILPDP